MVALITWDNWNSGLSDQFEEWLENNWHLVISYKPAMAPHAGEDSVIRMLLPREDWNPSPDDMFRNGGTISIQIEDEGII